jgi:hypothetical protein
MANSRIPGPFGTESILAGLLASPFLDPSRVPPAPGMTLPGILPPKLLPRLPSGRPYRQLGTKTSEMNLSFNPSESRLVGRCDRILFVQVCQIIADGKPILPGKFFAGFKFRDAWALADGSFVDLLAPDSIGPHYEATAAIGFHRESPPGSGQVISDSSIMGDAPVAKNQAIMFDPVKNPKGFKEALFKLEVFATCAAGSDLNKFYEGVRWTWKLTERENRAGGLGTVQVVETNVETPSPAFFAALDKFLRFKAARAE